MSIDFNRIKKLTERPAAEPMTRWWSTPSQT